MIDRDHKLSITRQASLLNISPGTVYYLPQPVSPADLALMRRIDELHLEHPFMGPRMLRDQMARQGIHAGRRHIRTLMLRMGIEALTPQPGTSKAAPGHKIYPYLLRKLAICSANQVWALDTTYIPMARGFVYLTAVVDNSAPSTIRPESTYKSGKVVQTNGAISVARAIAKTEACKQSCKLRKKVEMLFAHLKRILNLGRLRLRGLSGAKDEFLLAATAQNLRRMAKWLMSASRKAELIPA